jgi:hypothetical protein
VSFFACGFDFRICHDEEEAIQLQCCPSNSEPGSWFTIPDSKEEMIKYLKRWHEESISIAEGEFQQSQVGQNIFYVPGRCKEENSIDGEGNKASSRGSSGNEDFHVDYDRWDLTNSGESAEL